MLIEENIKQFLLVLLVSLSVATLPQIFSWFRRIPYTLPVLARTLGYSGEHLFTLTWSLEVAQFLQGVTLLSAVIFSVYPLLRITGRSLLSNLPHLSLILGFTFFFFQLMVF
jgi:hypothetical protein